MGQYYRAVDIDTGECILTWDHDCGAKLTEHSYVGNGFTDAVQHAIGEGRRIVLCGDYAWDGGYGDRLRAMGFDADPWESDRRIPVAADAVEPGGYRFTIDVDRGEYVDRSRACVAWVTRDEGTGKVSIVRYDPTCLLLAVGNGLGGGDYRDHGDGDAPSNADMVGAWAGDALVATDDPADVDGLAELPCPFDEEGVFLTATDAEIERAIASGKAKGRKLRDFEGNEYTDWSFEGVKPLRDAVEAMDHGQLSFAF